MTGSRCWKCYPTAPLQYWCSLNVCDRQSVMVPQSKPHDFKSVFLSCMLSSPRRLGALQQHLNSTLTTISNTHSSVSPISLHILQCTAWKLTRGAILCLQNVRAPTASFTITGNTLLANVTALQGVGSCSAASPYNTVNVPVSVQVPSRHGTQS